MTDSLIKQVDDDGGNLIEGGLARGRSLLDSDLTAEDHATAIKHHMQRIKEHEEAGNWAEVCRQSEKLRKHRDQLELMLVTGRCSSIDPGWLLP